MSTWRMTGGTSQPLAPAAPRPATGRPRRDRCYTPPMAIVGTVRELWRYPVKSMGGERLEHATLGAMGIPGDRGWAVRDEAAGEIRGGKKLPALMRCRARYLREPSGDTVPPAEITLPDGAASRRDDATSRPALGHARPRRHALAAPAGREPRSLPPWPARQARPDRGAARHLRAPARRAAARPLGLPPELFEFTSPLGTYFDAFPLHVLTTASLATLGAEAPPERFDRAASGRTS